MIALVTLFLCVLGCSSIPWPVDLWSYEDALDQDRPWPQPKLLGGLSTRDSNRLSFSRTPASTPLDLEEKRNSVKSKRQDSDDPMCQFNVYMCRKTHHPLCTVTNLRSPTKDMCTTRVTCDVDETSIYNPSAVCFAIDNAFKHGTSADSIMFHYKVKLFDQGGTLLSKHSNSGNNPSVSVNQFLNESLGGSDNIKQFKIKTDHSCSNLSDCQPTSIPS